MVMLGSTAKQGFIHKGRKGSQYIQQGYTRTRRGAIIFETASAFLHAFAKGMLFQDCAC
jgi:hypothetical protein